MTLRRSVRPRRAVTVASLGGASLLAAAALSATALPPAASAATTATAIETYDGEISVAASGQDYAIVGNDERTADGIFVGHGTAKPTLADGIGADAFGPIHFGTTASGATVLVYSRSTKAGGRMQNDLFSWDVKTHAERRIAGVNTAAGDENEGVMDRGRVAFLRARGSDQVSTPSLMYKPASGTVRLLSKQGGSQLALGPSGVLRVLDATENDRTGLTDPSLLQRLSLTGTATTLRRQGVGEDFQQLISPAFTSSGGVQVLLATLSGSTLYRVSAAGKTVQQARTGKDEVDVAFTGPTSAYAVRKTFDAETQDEHYQLVRLTKIGWGPVRG